VADWSVQRRWEDITPGDRLPPVAFPLSLYRLVMAAGATRDFNSIHHNREYARSTGAPDAYANTMFLMGMWERAVREFIGLAGELRAFTGFRMRAFNPVGETVTVHGRVERTWLQDGAGLAHIELWSQTSTEITVGPGAALVALPRRDPLPITSEETR
jgi:acyl dehydratase